MKTRYKILLLVLVFVAGVVIAALGHPRAGGVMMMGAMCVAIYGVNRWMGFI